MILKTNWKRALTALCVTGLCSFGLTACGSNSELPAVEGGFGVAPKISSGVAGKEPKELKKAVLVAGKGETCGNHAVLRVNYTGQLWDGKVFDSSFERAKKNQGNDSSIAFSLDTVIKGWQQGLKDAKPGSRVELVIPPDLGYGKQASATIPANSTLVFVVDILSCYTTKEAKAGIENLKKATATGKGLPGVKIDGALGTEPKITISDTKLLPKKQEVIVLAEGHGPVAKANDFIIYQVTGKSTNGKEPTQSTWSRGADKLNSVQTPPALAGKKVGSRVLIFYPSSGQSQARVIVVDILGAIAAPQK